MRFMKVLSFPSGCLMRCCALVEMCIFVLVWSEYHNGKKKEIDRVTVACASIVVITARNPLHVRMASTFPFIVRRYRAQDDVCDTGPHFREFTSIPSLPMGPPPPLPCTCLYDSVCIVVPKDLPKTLKFNPFLTVPPSVLNVYPSAKVKSVRRRRRHQKISNSRMSFERHHITLERLRMLMKMWRRGDNATQTLNPSFNKVSDSSVRHPQGNREQTLPLCNVLDTLEVFSLNPSDFVRHPRSFSHIRSHSSPAAVGRIYPMFKYSCETRNVTVNVVPQELKGNCSVKNRLLQRTLDSPAHEQRLSAVLSVPPPYHATTDIKTPSLSHLSSPVSHEPKSEGKPESMHHSLTSCLSTGKPLLSQLMDRDRAQCGGNATNLSKPCAPRTKKSVLPKEGCLFDFIPQKTRNGYVNRLGSRIPHLGIHRSYTQSKRSPNQHDFLRIARKRSETCYLFKHVGARPGPSVLSSPSTFTRIDPVSSATSSTRASARKSLITSLTLPWKPVASRIRHQTLPPFARPVSKYIPRDSSLDSHYKLTAGPVNKEFLQQVRRASALTLSRSHVV